MNASARLTLRFKTADTLTRWIMPHTIRIQSTIFAWAESDFSRLVAHTIKAFGADCLERGFCFVVHYYLISIGLPHCSAIAAAMPGNVLLASLALSA